VYALFQLNSAFLLNPETFTWYLTPFLSVLIGAASKNKDFE